MELGNILVDSGTGFLGNYAIPDCLSYNSRPSCDYFCKSVKEYAFVIFVWCNVGLRRFDIRIEMCYLGISLGMSLSLGFCATFGTIIPPIYAGTVANLFLSASGLAVLTGVIVCMVGISICGYAGVLKERELTDEQKRSAIKEFALTKGFMVALFAGVMSACMAFAIQAGKPIARVAVEAGTQSVYQNNPVFIFAMGGGFTTNCIWCLILILKNKSIKDFTQAAFRRLSVNYLLALIGGTTWYMQFFFYGMGTTKLGKEYDFASWTIHMAFIILFSNLWGMAFNEWKGSSRKTFKFVFLGLFVLLLSTLVIGYGNYIASHR